MGKGHVSAYKWAKKMGVQWSKLSPSERGGRVRAGMGKRHAVPCNSLGVKRDDDKALLPAQQRIGGKFWMVNNKTGERVHKASTGGLYLHASLTGWTDWDWGQDQ